MPVAGTSGQSMTGAKTTLGQAIAILEGSARRDIAWVVAVSCVSAISSSVMIAALMQFLVLLSSNDAVSGSTVLGRLYQLSGADSEFELLTILGVITIILLVVSTGSRVLNTYAVTNFSANQTRMLRRRLLTQYLHMPYSFHLDRNSADMSANLLSEVERTVTKTLRPAMELVPAVLTSLAVIAVLAVINLQVTIASILIVGLAYGAIYLVIRPHIKDLGARRLTANKDLYLAANESLSGIKEIIVLGREDHYLSHFDAASAKVEDTLKQLIVLIDIPRYIIQSVVFVAVIIFCLAYISESTMRSADAAALVPLLGAFAAAGQRLVPEFQTIYKSVSSIRFGGSTIERLYEDLQTPVDTTPPVRQPIRLRDTLELRNVSFSYPGSGTTSISNADLTVRAGEKIGIAGMSGAGKTTLGDIILGLLPPTSGALLVDGTRVEGPLVRAWQQSVGFVPQDIFLADASVADNIALGIGAHDIDMQRVKNSAEMAQISAFVEGLPEGFKTIVGERGVRLSGGQRQRIAIARALYKGVDLLFLDEATSALDTPTEKGVISAIRNLPGDITVIMVAHRMTTLDICDRIVMVSDGRIIGCDAKDNLLASSAEFRDLQSA